MSVYKQYLESEQWEHLRGLVMDRAKGKCELCEAPAECVHHVRYPKRFADDHPDNLLALCNACHKKSHGIRVKKVQIMSEKKITFKYRGKSKTYRFDFALIDGRPWIALREVERVIAYEDQWEHQGKSIETYDRRLGMGSILENKAATLLSPRERRSGSEKETWVTASGAIQVLARSDSAAGQALREQLGAWIEKDMLSASQALAQSGNASLVRGKGLSLLRQMHEELGSMHERQGLMHKQVGAVLDTLDEHGEEILKLSERQDHQEAMSQAHEKALNDLTDKEREFTTTFLSREAPDLADRNYEFGKFLSQKIKEQGGRKAPDGWILDGEYESKYVPVPNAAYGAANKWRKVLMAKWLPVFRAKLQGGWS